MGFSLISSSNKQLIYLNLLNGKVSSTYLMVSTFFFIISHYIGSVTITYKNGTNYRYDNTTYDFYFTFTNTIEKDGYIVLSLHNDFLTIAPNCTINSGFDFNELDSVLCGKFGTDRTIITLNNFTIVDGHQLMWVTIEMTNPATNGSFPISVESFNSKGKLIDKGEALISVSATSKI